MTKTPGASPGSSAFPAGRPYASPWLALGIAALGYLGTLLILSGYPGLRARMADAPGWVLAMLDIIVICLPLVVAVLAAGAVASRVGIAVATGIRHWRGLDVLLGLGVGLIVRALVELVAPTVSALGGGFGAPDLAASVVIVVGAVFLSPFIEEWFFRGLVLRAFLDALKDLGRTAAGIIAIFVSTVAFMALHFLPWESGIAVGQLIGTFGIGVGCGILTFVTGRLGGAIVAHVVFNAVGVGLMLW
ncbi:hypothetical protein ASD65_15720 [Microbacterium sp. Root61]|uniref:CPBP family intramembrane glutamic endopeptidase n=1 Tax=Microbacterium sp. Root61 TaxID=1736570 RepID=UPI0006FD1028|nr:CPBP family intramembrane glutamic endopeptidase [Microbacterium sp. Root61]KRA25709.1 hypothetical protein ASD65_15720 [Microbacterium sp. Root61]